MARGPCTFKQRDLTAAMKAGGAYAKSVGIPVDRVVAKIDTDGAIRITVASEPVRASWVEEASEWDTPTQ